MKYSTSDLEVILYDFENFLRLMDDDDFVKELNVLANKFNNKIMKEEVEEIEY